MFFFYQKYIVTKEGRLRRSNCVKSCFSLLPSAIAASEMTKKSNAKLALMGNKASTTE